MKNLFFAFLFTPIVIFANGNNDNNEKKYDVLLPEQTQPSVQGISNQLPPGTSELWQRFNKDNGKWSAMFDPYTGTAVRAFGQPIAIDGYEKISKDNIQDASMAFLKKNSDLLKIKTDNLKFIQADFVNNRWYVSFRQTYDGIEVLFSEVELRIFGNGKVMAFGVEFFNVPDLIMKPTISPNVAFSSAYSGMEGVKNTNEILSQPPVYVLPIKNNGQIDFKLIYEFEISDETKSYNAYVDAHNGSLLWRYSNTYNMDVKFQTKGSVVLKTPGDTPVNVNFPYETVTVNSTSFTSDSSGQFNCDIFDTSIVSSSLEGKWAKVENVGLNTAKYEGKAVANNINFIINWNDTNSTLYERNIYYYVNKIHDFFKSLDSNLTCIDRKIFVKLYYTTSGGFSGVNAFSKRDSIGFTGVIRDTARLAGGPSVLYHEYGHSVNNIFFISKGLPNGMRNLPCHEAIADITSAMILDEPRTGLGIFKKRPLSYLRNCNNDCIFPDSVDKFNGHRTGQILSGAFWDLKLLTSLTTLQKLSHFARYGLPDDVNTETSFFKWFFETLIADDDDGDLSNGTPHGKEIVSAFSKHKIGLIYGISRNFQHTQYPDTSAIVDNYKIKFKIDNFLEFVNLKPVVFYQVNKTTGTSSFVRIDAEYDEFTKTYFANIPKQEKGSLINYYFALYDSIYNRYDKIRQLGNDDGLFSFLVGYDTKFLDDFEGSPNWTFGTQEDKAKIGKWTIGVPQKLEVINYGIIKPEADYTANGMKCMITGLDIPSGTFTMDSTGNRKLLLCITNGLTTVTSQVFDLSPYNLPVIQFYKYFYQYLNPNILFTSVGMPQFKAQLSNDGGLSWLTAYIDTIGTQSWKKINIRFTDYLNLTNKCMVRFIYDIYNSMDGTPEVVGSVSIDDFRILDIDEKLSNEEVTSNSENSLDCIPNPIENEAVIHFSVIEPQKVTIKIYSLLGLEVNSIINSYYNSGEHQISLNTSYLENGLYILKLFEGNRVFTKRVIINKK
ncbi:MAG: cysteine-rich repeat protein [Ignavibacteria bacterium]|nr:cysteine-rich repeat protein [Ignavibacteria bacterium]